VKPAILFALCLSGILASPALGDSSAVDPQLNAIIDGREPPPASKKDNAIPPELNAVIDAHDNGPAPRPRKAGGITKPPPASRVPTDRGAAAKNQPVDGLSKPQASDDTPFAGQPDTSDTASAGDAKGAAPAAAPVQSAPVGAIRRQSAGTSGPSQPPPIPSSAPVLAPLQLVEIFSVEQNPGQGLLNYVRGTALEKIDFGAAPGRFGVGMIFRGEYLPDQLGPEFKRKNVIQIALGTLRSRLQGQTPQFGAITVISDTMPDARTRYVLRLPSGQTTRPETGALMLFTSPSSPVEQSDEEKLKSTYFAQAGTLVLAPEGKPKFIDVHAQGKRLTFRMQLVSMEIDTKLVTPFNAQEASLNGTVEFPIYWSEDRSGDLLAKQIASESFGIAGSISVLDEPADSPRRPASRRSRRKHPVVPDDDDSDVPGM
jgi:hypothetical protein